jgi:hypothetical protein
MLKTKKQYILIGGVLVTIVVGFILIFNTKREIPRIVTSDNNYIEEKIELKPEIPIKEKKKVELLAQDVERIKISLEVSGKSYKSEVKIGSSVFEAMEIIKRESTETNLFDFKSKVTPGLGNFITEINGLKGSPGKYWIYYVNNEKATIGASKYILKEGDIIKWNQEGI